MDFLWAVNRVLFTNAFVSLYSLVNVCTVNVVLIMHNSAIIVLHNNNNMKRHVVL